MTSPLAPTVLPLYKVGKVLIRNTGNYLRLIPHRGSQLFWGDKTYELAYIQIHTPSEHHIAGEAFPVEIQFVHKSLDEDDQSMAVLALLVKQGQPSPFLRRVLEDAPREALKENMMAAPLNLAELIPRDMTQSRTGTRVSYPHYTYEGSLTTPPCTDGVRWFVWSKPDHASKEQIAQLMAMFPFASARPLQPAQERMVMYRAPF